MRILVVTKSFPPFFSARAFQTGKVARALANAGTDITVITGHRGASVKKVNFPFPVFSIRYTDPFSSLFPKRAQRADNSLLQLYSNSWVRSAVRLARRLHNEKPFDFILSQSNPFDGHLVAFHLKKQIRLPWCVSFSDPFPPRILPKPYTIKFRNRIPGLYALQMNRLRSTLTACDCVHVSAIKAAELLEKKSNVKIMSKTRSIPHIGGSVPHRLERNGRIAHIGQLSRARWNGNEEMIKAFSTAAQKYHRFKGVDFIGACDQAFAARISQSGHDGLFSILPSVGHEESLAVMQRYSALLVIEAKMEFSPFLPSKFSDYARSGKPIMALTPTDSAISRYLSEYGGGIAVPQETEKIVDAIRRLFESDSPIQASEQLSYVFTPEHVGTSYASWFEEVCKSFKEC
ncbi:MAG: hypothetical protein ACOX6D_09955 [Thermoguttaceae bacterium]|jgi:hypothetical protein